MWRNPNHIWLCLILFCGMAHAGCSARKPIASNAASFRLEAFHNDSLLLSPAIPEGQSMSASIRLTLSGRVRSSVNPECSVNRGAFRVDPGTSYPPSIDIYLPAPDRWLSDLEGKIEPDGSAEVEALDAFLLDVDGLQQAGCFPDTSVSIRDFILQNIPMRPQESYYNAYGYRSGRSGLDLKPGIRLKIERAYFRPAMAGEDEYDAKTFLGLSTVYFDAELSNDKKTDFRQVGDIQYSPATLNHTAAEGRQDLALARLPPEFRYRLFFYSYLVAEKQRRSAAIIGSSNVGKLDELDQELRANPKEDCKNAEASGGVACFTFDGFVTLSSQISVELNGKPKFIEWGVRVKDVLPRTLNARGLKSLRIERRFAADRYYDVQFDRSQSTVLSLVLVGGDRVTWSKPLSGTVSH
jgi:hypothetical protein